MNSKAGFTKKDVVVVLGCVAFLLANIGAIGSGGRRRAKEAVCLSNLRQWGTIFQTYTNEHDGYFMGGWYLNPNCPTCPREAWYASLRSYVVPRGGLACCPEAVKPDESMSGSTFIPWGGPDNFAFIGGERGDYASYGTNSAIYNKPTQPGGEFDQDYWRRTDVAGADNIPVFLDSTWPTSYPWYTNTPPEYEGARLWSGAGGGGMGIFCINRHNGTINGLFMDFSARKIGLKELWTLKWSREFDVNGPWTIAGGVTYDDWANHGTGWMKDFKDY